MKTNNKRVYNNVLETIGSTPLIKLNKYPKEMGVQCNVFAKAEFFNPGGSIKDRTGLNMLEEAEKRGDIKPGYTIVESTSGNTGLGLAIACAVKSYKLIITIPDKMSQEKIDLLKSMGAEVILTNFTLPHEHPESYTSIARRLGNQPNHFYIDQYNNEDNPAAHYKNTADEIFNQMEGKIDYIFIGTGTCGTITGNGRRLKELDSKIRVIGIDPVGSQVALPAELNNVKKMYKTEGMGQSYIPKIMDHSVVDGFVKVDDLESLNTSREVISKEGLLVGGSSGSIIHGAMEYLKTNNLEKNENLRCVVILPDSTRNYISKLGNDAWMVGNGFLPASKMDNNNHPFHTMTVYDLKETQAVSYYDRRMTISDCLDVCENELSVIPIRENSQIIGVINSKNLMNKIITNNLQPYSSCLQCLSRDYLEVDVSTPLSVIYSMLDSKPSVLVTKRKENKNIEKLFVVTNESFLGLVNERTREIF